VKAFAVNRRDDLEDEHDQPVQDAAPHPGDRSRRVERRNDQPDAEYGCSRRPVGTDLLVDRFERRDQDGAHGSAEQADAHEQHPDPQDQRSHARDSICPIPA